jgi:hypothetical protein
MPTCLPGQGGTRKRMWLPAGSNQTGHASALHFGGFCAFWITLCISFDCRATRNDIRCAQGRARLFYSISHTRNTNARSWSSLTAAPPLLSWRLRSPGRSACHPGKRTRGICIQLAAPDLQSNVAKKENSHDAIQFEADETPA